LENHGDEGDEWITYLIAELIGVSLVYGLGSEKEGLDTRHRFALSFAVSGD